MGVLARKALLASIVTLAVLGCAEGSVRAVGRRPPPLPGVARATVAELVVDSDVTTLRQGPDRRLDPRLPTRKGTRPRVLILGESSVRGAAQTDRRYWFPDRLADRAPDLEVLNLGAPGQSLAGILRIVQALDPLEPDLVVLYAGHNEFSHPIFAGDVTGSRLWLLPVYTLMGRSWLLGAGAALLDKRTYLPTPPRAGATPAWVFTDDRSLLESRATVLQRFRADFTAIVAASPAPVLVSTLLRNFDYGPTGVFVGDAGGEGCRQALTAGPHMRPTATESAAAHAACGKDSAVARWSAAQVTRAAGGDPATAWRDSLALDPLPLRAPLEADDLIREIAAARGVPLVDLAAKLGPFPEGRLFTDTLHPSPEGAQAIAAELLPAVRAALAERGR